MDLAKSHLILKNQYMKKFILLRYICRNEFSNLTLTLKLTLLFQLFSKFRENVIWPIKAKSMISAKIFFRETPEGFYIEIDNKAYFWRRHNRFRKNYYLIGNNFVGENFRHAKFFVRENFHHLAKMSSLFYNENCYLNMKKGNIWKQATLITKPHEFSRILVLYKISYGRI